MCTVSGMADRGNEAAMNIGIIGFGEVGQLISRQFVARGHAVKVWDRLFAEPFSSVLSLARRFEGLELTTSTADLVSRSDLVFSAVTAGNAIALARECADALSANQMYIDLNSVSPGAKVTMADLVQSAGGRFVEAAILSPIHPKGVASPILVAGPYAAQFAELGPQLGFEALTVASDMYGKAAATKMCRSVVIKGLEGLIAESMMAARSFGVEAPVLASLKNLLPRDDWPEYANYMIQRTLLHGTRRSEEMQEVATTLSEVGVSPTMVEACVTRQAWMAARIEVDAEATLEETLDSLLHQMNRTTEE